MLVVVDHNAFLEPRQRQCWPPVRTSHCMSELVSFPNPPIVTRKCGVRIDAVYGGIQNPFTITLSWNHIIKGDVGFGEQVESRAIVMKDKNSGKVQIKHARAVKCSSGLYPTMG